MAPAPVAVAVVSWNTRELLDACLASLRGDHEAGCAEVWVVDNGSTDGSAALVAERHPWVRLEALRANLGFGGAVAHVAARTDTPFLVAANADVQVQAGSLSALRAAAARHPRAGSLAPRLVLPDGRTQHSVHPFPGVRLGLALSTGLAAWGPLARRLALEGAWDPEVGREVDWAHGAFLLVRREAWQAAGGMDPEQWLYAEDLDLAWRLRRAGWTTRYVPSARVRHAVSAATALRWDALARDVRAQRAVYAWMLDRQGWWRTRATGLAHLAGPWLRARAARAAARRAAPGSAARASADARAARQGAWALQHRAGLARAVALRSRSRRPA